MPPINSFQQFGVPISINSFQLIVVSLKPLTGVDSGSLSFLPSGCTL